MNAKSFLIRALCLLFAIVTFFSLHTSVSADSLTATVTGNTADVKVTVASLNSAAIYAIQIGTTVDSGVTCDPSPNLVKTFTAGQNNPLDYPNIPLASFTTYCVGLQVTTPPLLPVVTYFTGASNTFTTSTTSLINSSTPPSTPTPNSTGCVSSDNSTYCMLAPLPGIGDATGKVDLTKGVGSYINGIIQLVLGLIGVLAVLMIVVGGIEYMSTVSMGEKEGAKSRITNALLGLLLALTSYLILNTINPDLVNLNITVPGTTLSLGNGTAPITNGGVVTGGTGGGSNASGGNTPGAPISTPTGTLTCPQNNGVVQATVNGVPTSWAIKTGAPWPADDGSTTQVPDPNDSTKTVTLGGDNTRTTLTNNGIQINAADCTTVGQNGCTSVVDLPAASVQGLISLENTCGNGNCGLVVTGGTECWEHSSHGPGLPPVDLRETPALIAYVESPQAKKTCISWGSGTGGFCGGGTSQNWQYTVGTTNFVDEGDHFHVRNW